MESRIDLHRNVKAVWPCRVGFSIAARLLARGQSAQIQQLKTSNTDAVATSLPSP
jgi:hypothetical protein